MARRAARVVVARLAIADRSAVGLQQHDHLAATKHGQTERVSRFAPRLDQLALQARRQRVRRGKVDVLGIAHQQALDVAGLPVASAGVVAFGREQIQDLSSARRRVEADGVAGAAAACRIVGQDQRETPLGARLGPKPGPGGRQSRHVVHAIDHGLVAQAGEFQARIGGRLRLEGDGAGQQPAVQFGQHDVHGEVGRREAALRVLRRPRVDCPTARPAAPAHRRRRAPSCRPRPWPRKPWC